MTPGQLAELREMHRDNGTNDDKWRVLGYQKGSFVIRDLSLSCSKLWLAIGSLKAYPSRIKSREEALKLRGISDKTADKVSQFTAYLDSDLISFQIMEIIRTGELQRIKYTKTEDLKVMRLFSGIYGVGQFLEFYRLIALTDSCTFQALVRQGNGFTRVSNPSMTSSERYKTALTS